MERRGFRPQPRYARLGVTGLFAIVALLVIMVAAWLVDMRSASTADRKLAELVTASKEDPVDLLTRAARANRILFLSDIHNSPAVKDLAARAISKIATTSGLDAVIIDVGADQQPYIDGYLDRTPEDASILLSNPRTLGEPGSATRAYMTIYHTVWQLNAKLGADRRIRIIAADLPGWPPNAPSPGETARKMEAREDHMEQTIQTQVLTAIPDARLLIFMDGLHALKGGRVAVHSGGVKPVDLMPLAARLAQRSSEVYTVLVDAPSSGMTGHQLVAYDGTRVSRVLTDAGANRRFATRVTNDFDYLRAPILETKTPGVNYQISPRSYTLREVADAYINLGH